MIVSSVSGFVTLVKGLMALFLATAIHQSQKIQLPQSKNSLGILYERSQKYFIVIIFLEGGIKSFSNIQIDTKG